MHNIAAKPIVGDINMRGINIDSAFNGVNLLLFGVRNDAGNIVIVIRGPSKSYIVRKKDQVAGIWMNTDSYRFDNINSYYAIASNVNLDNINNDYLLNQLGVGVNNMTLTNYPNANDLASVEFLDALLDEKESKNLYPANRKIENVSFIGDTLFRSNIRFPETIERGTYIAEFYLFNDGQLIGIQSTPIVVKKIGFDAFIYDLAHKHSFFYGLLAIFIAIASGWIASYLFQRR
ncbi:MAG: TIGR02186 family protein [Pseudomonadota bacterium]